MSKIDELFRKAMAAADAMSPAERRKALEEIAWEEGVTRGPEFRYVHEGQRHMWHRGKQAHAPLHEIPEEELHWVASSLRGRAPFFKKISARDLIKRKVTIYKSREMGFGVNKIEASSYYAQVAPYAQHDKALQVMFIPKGGRNARGYWDSPPYTSTLILDGWGHPDPYDPLKRTPGVVHEGGVTSYHIGGGRTSFDPKWESDFNKMIDEHIKRTHARVLVDVRA